MYAVIMAGGGGTRLWPLSRMARPKPFLPLLGDRTLLQATVARLSPMIEPRRRVRGHGRPIRRDRPRAGPRAAAGQPAARAHGSQHGSRRGLRGGRAWTGRTTRSWSSFPRTSGSSTRRGSARRSPPLRIAPRAATCVTLGISATRPETGYGYVLATGAAEPVGGRDTYRVERFVEKPIAGACPGAHRRRGARRGTRASSCGGGTRCATGWRAHAPDIWEAVVTAVAGGPGAIAAAYPAIRSTSIDYALLEPASAEGRVAVVPASVGWSDLGSWNALLDAGDDPDSVRTHGHGRSSSVGGERSLVRADWRSAGRGRGHARRRSWWTRPMRCWCAPPTPRRTSSRWSSASSPRAAPSCSDAVAAAVPGSVEVAQLPEQRARAAVQHRPQHRVEAVPARADP